MRNKLSQINLTESMNTLPNAFIIIKYNGIDPELQESAAYPNPRSIVIWLKCLLLKKERE